MTTAAAPPRPTPQLLARLVPAEFHAEWRDPQNEWQTCTVGMDWQSTTPRERAGTGVRRVPPGQPGLELLVQALLREFQHPKFEVRVAVASVQGGRVLTAYDTIGPRSCR